MNSKILKEEINNLLRVIGDLERSLLDEESPEIKTNYFNVDVRNKRQYKTANSEQRTANRKIVSYRKENNVLNKNTSSLIPNPDSRISSVDDREQKVINILKDKGQVSIKDISEVILDCSEKTIQRLLNKMIKDGRVVKKGERRWAKYELKNTV